MGRPRVNDIDKRIHQVNIRLTEEENTKVSQYAIASGVSPANWIRKKVFTGKFPSVKMTPIDAAVYQELKKIGINLNQVTHRINQGENMKGYMVIQIELLGTLKKILKALIDDRQSDQG